MLMTTPTEAGDGGYFTCNPSVACFPAPSVSDSPIAQRSLKFDVAEDGIDRSNNEQHAGDNNSSPLTKPLTPTTKRCLLRSATQPETARKCGTE